MNVTSFNEKNKQNIASTIDILFKNNIQNIYVKC